MLLFEVLLDVRGLVFDVEAGLHAIGDHARPVAVGGRRRGASEAQREEEADAVRAPEVEILADDGFEEVAALHGWSKTCVRLTSSWQIARRWS